jgi:hypothetical protein
VQLVGRLPFHPIALAAYSVLFVYAANVGEVLPVDATGPTARAILAAVALTAVVGLVYRDMRRGALVASAIVIAFAFFGHASPALAGAGIDERTQLVAWGVAVGLVALVAIRARGSLPRMTLALNAFSLVLVAFVLAAIVPYEAGRAARVTAAEPTDDPSIPTATRRPERDIYYLVFDRYGSDWSIRQRFGLENDLPEWLADQGFQVVPGARSNYRATDLSLASTLNLRYLDDLTEFVGRESGDRTPARKLLQRHAVGAFLRANGYRYIHVGPWWSPTASSEIADEVLQEGKESEFGGVLYDASVMPAIDRLLGRSDVIEAGIRDRHRNSALFQFRQLQRLPSAPGRKFVFAHILMPHNPYVFRADGSPVYEGQAVVEPEEQLYAGQLAFTNARIRETVAALLAGPDESDPIVVIQADEGPFLCRNVDCVDGSPETYGIRLGVLAAYYLPGLPARTMPPTHSLVNTFRTIFREYFGADLPRLPDRSYSWPDNEHLYDFQDVTDILPLPTTYEGE